nr:DEAD/DEAH box helicase [Chitinophagales bacterium]
MEKAIDILKKYWGYNEFRPQQQEIIETVAAGKDSLALLPTGGGKSICYQIPALMHPGICIVISPLIALMKDQVEQLNALKIPAVAVYSGLTKKQVDIELDNAAYGKYKLLYISPERLISPLFKERLKKMQVNLLAVDEAHCISQWGYDFRPPYLQIASVHEIIPDTPIIALTA